jgi:beta-fructofuranosidase
MLAPDDVWVWDSWLVDDGRRYHLFYLQAPRSIAPEQRHWNVSIGHAVSGDLSTWIRLPDALRPADEPAWDDATTWTGSVIACPDGLWRMYYTGTSKAEGGKIQRIGLAVSEDLVSWARAPMPPLRADPRWYERLGDCSRWSDEAWRDPYVFADPGGDGWHMLVCGRSKSGPWQDRGVVGHLRSDDLEHWEAQPPLTQPGAGFAQLEVPQIAVVEGQPVLVFSCLEEAMPPTRQGARDGVWTVRGDSAFGPFDVSAAVAFDHPSIYAAHLVQRRDGRWVLIGFRNEEDGRFVGAITDPIPVAPIEGPAGIAAAGSVGTGVHD